MGRQAQVPAIDIDYIIMVNAHEESRLAELLADFMQQSPELTEVQAKKLLKPQLLQLLVQEKIGIYTLELRQATQAERQPANLEVSKALQIVDDDENWVWTPPEGSPFYCLFAIDRSWWGQTRSGKSHDT